MAFLTNEKLTIVGAAGMIGSNMAQSALMMGLTSEICLYDVFSPEGVAEEMPRRHSRAQSTSSLQVVRPVRLV